MILVTQLFGCPNNRVTKPQFGGLRIGKAKNCPGWRLDRPALDNRLAVLAMLAVICSAAFGAEEEKPKDLEGAESYLGYGGYGYGYPSYGYRSYGYGYPSYGYGHGYGYGGYKPYGLYRNYW
ncbi:unnamed protein product [Notodromas monacha]|uniref:Uncharacterized protein n=1 Tax=Notodromas monacha TaxID=399045 RepID=A0A7R9GJ31_9CRUS|nr:unnamed protein product [Notodromas monacha]CAG0924464.1 unnamed protein product [Notodromas monacha]